MDEEDLPPHVQYWLNTSSKHDCFFLVGPESGPIERIGAFKVFLQGHSEPFRNMLGDSDISEKGDVRIIDVEPDAFKLFLKCIYGIEKCDLLIHKISFQETVDLLYVVDKYLVYSIKTKLIIHLLGMLPCSCNPDSNTLNNVFIALENKVFFQDQRLENALLKLIQLNVEQLFSNDQFLQLSAEVLLLIIKLDSLQTTETNIWDAVVKWAKHNSKSDDGKVLRELISEHLKHIRFRVMGLEEFSNKVVKTGILTPDEVYEVCNLFGDEQFSNTEYICNITKSRSQLRHLETVDNFVSSHMIRNIHDFKDDFYCRGFICKDFSWNILVQKNQNNLGLFLHCNGNSKTDWKCHVEFKLYLINQHDHPKNNIVMSTEENTSIIFYETKNHWGWSNFYPWSKLLDPVNGFIKDDRIIVMVHIINVTEIIF